MTATEKCKECKKDLDHSQGIPEEFPDLCDDCYDARHGGLVDEDDKREAAHERAIEKWARNYDELNGAPESEEDR